MCRTSLASRVSRRRELWTRKTVVYSRSPAVTTAETVVAGESERRITGYQRYKEKIENRAPHRRRMHTTSLGSPSARPVAYWCIPAASNGALETQLVMQRMTGEMSGGRGTHARIGSFLDGWHGRRGTSTHRANSSSPNPHACDYAVRLPHNTVSFYFVDIIEGRSLLTCTFMLLS